MTYYSDMGIRLYAIAAILLLAMWSFSGDTVPWCGAQVSSMDSGNAPVSAENALMSESDTRQCLPHSQEAVASPLPAPLAKDKFPDISAWNAAPAVPFCSDWKGHNATPDRQTEVQLLWSPREIYVRFQARYRQLYLYPTQNSRQENLWLRDVAEVFLQPPGHGGYKEFETSPNGDWLAVDVLSAAEKKFSRLRCDVRSRGAIDSVQHIWTAELAIPMQCLTPAFDPAANWRVNFFRIEGAQEDRFYSAWHPTNTKQPNFHVPEVFGELKFAIQ